MEPLWTISYMRKFIMKLILALWTMPYYDCGAKFQSKFLLKSSVFLDGYFGKLGGYFDRWLEHPRPRSLVWGSDHVNRGLV